MDKALMFKNGWCNFVSLLKNLAGWPDIFLRFSKLWKSFRSSIDLVSSAAIPPDGWYSDGFTGGMVWRVP